MSSDKGTVHVFTLDAKRTEAIPTTEETSGETDASKHKNPVSALSFVSVSPLHFSSVRIAIDRFSASGLSHGCLAACYIRGGLLLYLTAVKLLMESYSGNNCKVPWHVLCVAEYTASCLSLLWTMM